MKYSQPILFACVGSAAIVSAMPTLADSSTDLSARTLPRSTVPQKSKSTKVGTRLGKLIKYGGVFAQQANPNQMEYSPRSLLSSVAKASSKQKVRKATSSLKRTGKAAIAAAGGGQAVAESLGSMLLGRANPAESTSASDSMTPVTAAPKPRKIKPKSNNEAKKPYSDPLHKHSSIHTPLHPSKVSKYSSLAGALDPAQAHQARHLATKLHGAREFQEALEERGIGGLGHALMAARRAKASSSSVEPAYVVRDVFHGDDLAERDFDEIDVRDFEINEID